MNKWISKGSRRWLLVFITCHTYTTLENKLHLWFFFTVKKNYTILLTSDFETRSISFPDTFFHPISKSFTTFVVVFSYRKTNFHMWMTSFNSWSGKPQHIAWISFGYPIGAEFPHFNVIDAEIYRIFQE